MISKQEGRQGMQDMTGTRDFDVMLRGSRMVCRSRGVEDDITHAPLYRSFYTSVRDGITSMRQDNAIHFKIRHYNSPQAKCRE